MKTLAAVMPILALFAGSISTASAQDTRPGMNRTQMPNEQGRVEGRNLYCIEISKGGGIECKYTNLATCEKDAQPEGLQCSPNPNLATTGSK